MDSCCESHSSTSLKQWEILTRKINDDGTETAIDGHNLDPATVVAVARLTAYLPAQSCKAYRNLRYGAQACLLDGILDRLDESTRIIQSGIESGQVVYGQFYLLASRSPEMTLNINLLMLGAGVNTGFGGSADTRPKEIEELQSTLIRELHCGILAPSSTLDPTIHHQPSNVWMDSNSQFSVWKKALPLGDGETGTVMPESWAKASMLIRINSLASGRSGIRLILLQRMLDILRNDIVPRIPLRGSISASGDLIPLSYIGGLLQGKPSITAWTGSRTPGRRRIVKADVALAESSLDPIQLGPKEGLAIINGTAVSTGVATLATYDANNLAVLSQVLTAMSVDALCGTRESFDPFFAMVRPHPGQVEVSQNIYSFLDGSKLIELNHGLEEGSLRQDRYSIRTASQWLGPVVEDLLLAYKQVTIECNSVTDNPLIDGEAGRILHGGNFQARATTSAMEKTRLAVQTIGQMLFAQCTELINPKLNYGLPPNLVADNPSTSFLMKSMDIMVAALQSELGFLATPAGSHIQSAEMSNQSLNSLALISARYTLVALDVLSQLASAHLFALCQALDLRAMHMHFLKKFEPTFQAVTSETLAHLFNRDHGSGNIHAQLWLQFKKALDQTTSLDPGERFRTVFRSLQPVVLDLTVHSVDTVPALRRWTEQCSKSAFEVFEATRDSYVAHPDATPFISVASARMYDFVRHKLSVPFLRGIQYDTTGAQAGSDDGSGLRRSQGGCQTDASVGSFVSAIYDSIRNGALYCPVMDCLADVKRNDLKTRSSL